MAVFLLLGKFCRTRDDEGERPAAIQRQTNTNGVRAIFFSTAYKISRFFGFAMFGCAGSCEREPFFLLCCCFLWWVAKKYSKIDKRKKVAKKKGLPLYRCIKVAIEREFLVMLNFGSISWCSILRDNLSGRSSRENQSFFFVEIVIKVWLICACLQTFLTLQQFNKLLFFFTF